VLIDDLAAELTSLGRERFLERYGKHFLVFTDSDLVDDVSSFVNTASREASEITAGARGRKLDLRPLVSGPRNPGATRITLGRSRSCDISIQHPRVSAVHAVFTQGGGLLFVSDAKSKNGTAVNGVKLKPEKPTPVDAGDTLKFGSVAAALWGLDDVIAAARRT
jgi:hypothetical protein